MRKAFRMFGVFVLVVIVFLACATIYIKAAMPNVGPAPELKIEKTASRVERGKYLANHVTVCMDCHSARDWNYYAAPVKGNFGGGGEKFGANAGFPGNFYSKNITPYGLSGWTDGEIFRAITTGVTKNGTALFPVMPYHGYGQMDPEDIYSIIAYLRTLAPVQNDVPPSAADFPVSILLNTMPSEATPGTKPAETDKVAYGKYLVTSAGCVECHSKMEKGARVEGSEFGGGSEFILPTGTVRSANITPDKTTGLGLWTEEAFVKRFKMYADSSYKPHKVGSKEMNTVMPWIMYAGMKESDLQAIYSYLKTLEPKVNNVVKFDPN